MTAKYKHDKSGSCINRALGTIYKIGNICSRQAINNILCHSVQNEVCYYYSICFKYIRFFRGVRCARYKTLMVTISLLL